MLQPHTRHLFACSFAPSPCFQSEAALEHLEQYPDEPEVHKYLHSRMMSFDQETLFELHYLMITLGKVFCQKR